MAYTKASLRSKAVIQSMTEWAKLLRLWSSIKSSLRQLLWIQHPVLFLYHMKTIWHCRWHTCKISCNQSTKWRFQHHMKTTHPAEHRTITTWDGLHLQLSPCTFLADIFGFGTWSYIRPAPHANLRALLRFKFPPENKTAISTRHHSSHHVAGTPETCIHLMQTYEPRQFKEMSYGFTQIDKPIAYSTVGKKPYITCQYNLAFCWPKTVTRHGYLPASTI